MNAGGRYSDLQQLCKTSVWCEERVGLSLPELEQSQEACKRAKRSFNHVLELRHYEADIPPAMLTEVIASI